MGFRPHLADRLSATGLRSHPLIVSPRWETSSSPPDPLSAMRRGGTTCRPLVPPLPKGEGARGRGHVASEGRDRHGVTRGESFIVERNVTPVARLPDGFNALTDHELATMFRVLFSSP